MLATLRGNEQVEEEQKDRICLSVQKCRTVKRTYVLASLVVWLPTAGEMPDHRFVTKALHHQETTKGLFDSLGVTDPLVEEARRTGAKFHGVARDES